MYLISQTKKQAKRSGALVLLGNPANMGFCIACLAASPQGVTIPGIIALLVGFIFVFVTAYMDMKSMDISSSTSSSIDI